MTLNIPSPASVWTVVDDNTRIIINTHEIDYPVAVNRKLDLFEESFEITISCSDCGKLFRTLANKPSYTSYGYSGGSVSVTVSPPNQPVQPGTAWVRTDGNTAAPTSWTYSHSTAVPYRSNNNVGIGTVSPSTVWNYKWYGDVDANCPHCDNNYIYRE